MKELHSNTVYVICKERFDELNEYLRAESLDELEEKGIIGYTDDELFFTFNFDDGCSIDITVASGNTNYYCDMTLYDPEGIEEEYQEGYGELEEHMHYVSVDGRHYVCDFEIVE